MNRILIGLLLISIAACSNKVMYDNLRLNQRQKCVKEPRSNYIECIKRTDKSYEDYERKRKELLETPDKTNLKK